jgi:flagellar FliL protein
MRQEAYAGTVIDQEGNPSKAGSSVISLVAALLLGVSVGATLPLTGVLAGSSDPALGAGGAFGTGLSGAEPAVINKPLTYVPLDPPFVVNFSGDDDIRFLQVAVEAGTHDPEVVERVREQRPAIRDSLLMLFSSKEPGALGTREGKEQLRGEALAAIRKVLTAQTGAPGVDSVFFTSFVMQ